MYKYEIHLHTNGCSRCGISSSSDMVRAAKQHGYAGVVFTNHFFWGNTCVDIDLPWSEFVKAYELDYLEALEVGQKLDIDVLFGIEEGYGGGHEALIYGLSPEIIASEPEFCHMSLAQISSFVRSNGGMIFCAHPFRDRAYITDPDIEPDTALFDGIEIYNQFNTPERNALAAEFAADSSYPIISGGDVHNAVHFGLSGLAFEERVFDNVNLIKLLRQQKYELLIGGKPYSRQDAVKLVRKMR